MEKMLLSVIASLCGVIVALGVYVWTRTISEYDKMMHDNGLDIKDLKDRMTALALVLVARVALGFMTVPMQGFAGRAPVVPPSHGAELIQKYVDVKIYMMTHDNWEVK